MPKKSKKVKDTASDDTAAGSESVSADQVAKQKGEEAFARAEADHAKEKAKWAPKGAVVSENPLNELMEEDSEEPVGDSGVAESTQAKGSSAGGFCCCGGESAETNSKDIATSKKKAKSISRLSMDPIVDRSLDGAIFLVKSGIDAEELRSDSPPGITVTQEMIQEEDVVGHHLEDKIKDLQEDLKMARVGQIGDPSLARRAAEIEAEIEAATQEYEAELAAEKERASFQTSMLSTSVVLTDPALPIGIDWQFHDQTAVVGNVRTDGDAGKYRKGEGVMPGMRLTSVVTNTKIDINYNLVVQDLLRERKARGMTKEILVGEEEQHLAVMLEAFGRPIELLFEEKKQPKHKELDTSDLQDRMGCNITPIEVTVPGIKGDLGLVIWKTGNGTPFVADVLKKGVLGGKEFEQLGIRAGLVLYSMVSNEDGSTRKFDGKDAVSTMKQQMAMMMRPFVFKFEPKVITMEFCISPWSCASMTKQDKKSMAALRENSKGSGEGWSVFRDLGLSLIEEDIGAADVFSDDSYRVRVAGLHPGGMIDRFNRQAGHPLIKVGMTLVSCSSPYLAKQTYKNTLLTQVVKDMHVAAPGIEFLDTVTTADPKGRKLDGKTITLGFSVNNKTGSNGPKFPDRAWLDKPIKQSKSEDSEEETQ